MDNIDLGKKIQEYRKLKKLSIKDLSDLTNLTASLLSQIERGLANPSINTVKIISKVLNVPLFTFFMQNSDDKRFVVRPETRIKMNFPNSKNVAYELLSPDLSGVVELGILKLPSNSESSEDLIEHGVEEVCYVMKGKIELYINDEVILLNTGDSAKIAALKRHKFINKFDEEVEIIFAVSPSLF